MATVGKIVLGGTLAGVQRWSLGFWLNILSGTLPTPTQMNTFAQSVYSLFDADVWSAASVPWKAQSGTGSTLDKCHAYARLNWSPQTWSVTGASTGAAVAGSGTRTQPCQSALVCTLLTDFAGRTGRGRVYLPLAASTYGGGGQLATPSVTTVALNIATFLQAVNGTALAGGAVSSALWGALGASFGPGGAAPVITSVRVDDVPDTQRRRRDKIVPINVGTHVV